MRRLLLAAVVAVAYFFSITSVWLDCRFVETKSEEGNFQALGLYRISYRHDQCFNYRDIPSDWQNLVAFNSSTRAAQAFGAMATILGGLACLFTIFGSCLQSFFTVPKKQWRTLLACSLLGAFVCQSFTFLLFVQVEQEIDCGSNEVECRMGWGGISSLIATCMYLVSGLIVLGFALQPPKENAGTNMVAQGGTALMLKMGITFKKRGFQRLRWQDVALQMFALLLFLFSLTVLLDCRFFRVNFNNNTQTYEEGLLSYYYYPEGVCKGFERGGYESFTAMTRAAQAFAYLAVIFGAMLMALIWAMTLFLVFPVAAYTTGLPALAFLAGFSQSLTFLSNNERNDILCAEDIADQSCEMGQDGILAACTVCLYILFIPALLWYAKNNNNSDIIVDDDNAGDDKDECAPAPSVKDLEPEIDAETGKDE